MRKKSQLLTGYMELLLLEKKNNEKKNSIQFQIITPTDPQQRGAQLSLKFNCNIQSIYAELIRRGIAVMSYFFV